MIVGILLLKMAFKLNLIFVKLLYLPDVSKKIAFYARAPFILKLP